MRSNHFNLVSPRTWPGPGARLSRPFRVEIDLHGRLLVVDDARERGSLRIVDAFLTPPDLREAAGFVGPSYSSNSESLTSDFATLLEDTTVADVHFLVEVCRFLHDYRRCLSTKIASSRD